MKLTSKEKKICKKFKADGCHNCPLMIDYYRKICYENVDGRSKEAKEARRY